jgi:hypothetical protein
MVVINSCDITALISNIGLDHLMDETIQSIGSQDTPKHSPTYFENHTDMPRSISCAATTIQVE